MPEKSTELKTGLKFDKNELTRALCGEQYYFWKSIFDNILNQTRRDTITPEDFQVFIDSETEKGHTNDVLLGKYQYELETNPNGDIAKAFRQYWEFMKCIFNSTYYNQELVNYKLILNKVDTFSPDVQLIILKRLRDILVNKGHPELMEIINTKIANNPHATIDDKINSAYGLLHKNHDIVRDVIEELKQELDKELKSDFPNQDKVKQICNSARYLMQRLQESFRDNDPHTNNIHNSLSQDYIKTVLSEFDINNVLTSDAEYIAKINQSLEERAVNAERHAKESDKLASQYEERNAEYNKLKMEHNETTRHLDAERAKNERLTGELDLLNKQIEKQNSFIKAVKMKIATLKTGLLAGNGVKDLQNFVNNEQSR